MDESDVLIDSESDSADEEVGKSEQNAFSEMRNSISYYISL